MALRRPEGSGATSCNIGVMTDHAEHLTAFAVLNTSGHDFHAGDEVEEWSVWNDPDFFESKFADGSIHPALRDKILGEPLFTSAVPGSAKRFQKWTNETRRERGDIASQGEAILRMRTISQSARRRVQGDEWDEIDDGRRANG